MANINWSQYNKKLIKRGEILLDFTTLKNWKKELKKMNKNKRGKPYKYPNTLITLIALIRILYHLPYRETQGFIKALTKHIKELRTLGTPDYTTIYRRTRKLNINIGENIIKSKGGITITVDSTGVKVHNGGDWIRKVWGVRKGYLKIHFGVDVRTKQVVSMAVTSEKVHDGRVLKRLVRGAFNVVRVRRLLGDGGYDSRENFSFLERVGVKPVIKVRRNASSRSKGCASRRQVVLELRRLGFRGWSRVHRYGRRWAVEGVFSWFKRVFGEFVCARKFVNMVKEVMLKVYLYNLFMRDLKTA